MPGKSLTVPAKYAKNPEAEKMYRTVFDAAWETYKDDPEREAKAHASAAAAVNKKYSMAEWDTAYINDLPDSAFAYVAPGGTKDGTGKTEPRSLRHLPYKDSAGKPDAAHVRNALARLDQTDIPADAKASAKRKLDAAAAGLDIATTNSERRMFVESFPATFEGTKVVVQLFPIGHWEGHSDGPMDITPEMLAKAKENFDTTGRALPVDFDHGLDYGNTPEQRRAAGWIKELEITDTGLFATFDATDEAAAWIKGGQYRFISPTYTYDYTNKESGESQGFTLLRAGLTNTPWFDGMFPCVAANERTLAVLREMTKGMAERAANIYEMYRTMPAVRKTVAAERVGLEPGEPGADTVKLMEV